MCNIEHISFNSVYGINLPCPDSIDGKIWVLSCVSEVGGGFLHIGSGTLMTEQGGS